MNKGMNRFRKTIANLIAPARNTLSLPAKFLKYGNKSMTPNWTEVVMSDQDLYTGYGYGAIRNRANLVARIALEYVKTKTEKEEKDGDIFIHPHLQMITDSRTFSDYDFWSHISTYLDLEGVYYLMAVRNVAQSEDEETEITRVGAVKSFKMLSPYNIRRVMDTSNPTVVKAYVETRKGMIREIPAGMIIEIRELNPFNEDNPYAMTDAAKDSQFTLKTAGDYTRHALRNNINAPGIISTDVVLEEEEFKIFMDRVNSHTKGEPLFGNGTGALTYKNMQTELTKAALKDVNEINRESLFAVSGVSKTMMGIEQSGTTRDTARVQKELMTENHILPRIQLIIDALNQDYENNYEDEYKKNKASIIIDNPLKTDHEAEAKDTEVKDKQLDIFSKLINRGVDPEKAAGYIRGEVPLEELDLEPMEFPDLEPVDKDSEDESKKKSDNEIKKERSGIIGMQEGSLRNSIQDIEAEVVFHMLERLRKKAKGINQPSEVKLSDISDLLTKTQEKRSIKDLAFVLGAFYGIIAVLRGGETARDRTATYNLPAIFDLNKEVKDRIKEISTKVAESHISTITSDIWKTAYEASLEGKGLDEIERLVRRTYAGKVSETRAATIARTETNRAFTIAQYEADKQFVKQNDLDGRVFKVWHTRSLNPCPFCLALEAEGAVPFSSNFRDLGGSVRAGDKVLKIEFDHLAAGNAHPNCSCDYELIIRD